MSIVERAYIGLGSNLGDREAILRLAVRALGDLPNVTLVGVSRVYETDAVGPGEQGAYLNAAIAIDTTLEAQELLEQLLTIELAAGRDRASETLRWSPRILDLDLLLFGASCIETKGLQVPHPRLHERGFVLEPLCDLAADVIHPGMHRTLGDLAMGVRDKAAVRLWSNDRVLFD